jgi:hypothetical protein
VEVISFFLLFSFFSFIHRCTWVKTRLLFSDMARAFLVCRRQLPGSHPALWLRSAKPQRSSVIATRSLSSAQNGIIFDNGNILVGKVEGKGMGMLAARRFETGATILEV